MSSKIKPLYSDRNVSIHQKYLVIGSTVVLLMIILAWLFVRDIQSAGRPSENQYPVLGLTLDQNDSYQDFQALEKYNVDFIYIKTTQGANYADDDFESNYSRLKGSQILFGFYHYVSLDTTVDSQFKNITKNLVMLRGDLPFMLKVTGYGEYNDHFPTKRARRITDGLMQKIKYYYGDNCIVQLDETSMSMAPYYKQVWIDSDKKPHSNWLFWQYSEDARIPGYASTNKYHISVMNGSKDDLNKMIQS